MTNFVRHTQYYTAESWRNGRRAVSKSGYVNCTMNILRVYFFYKTLTYKSEIKILWMLFFCRSWKRRRSQKRLHITFTTGTGPLAQGQILAADKYLSGYGKRKLNSTCVSIPLFNSQFQECYHSSLALDKLCEHFLWKQNTLLPLVAAHNSDTLQMTCHAWNLLFWIHIFYSVWEFIQ